MIFNVDENKPKRDPVFVIAEEKAKRYSITHKKGTRVVAESKDKSWKEGVIYGEMDWALFHFFFVIKFDDGEIIKQEERKVSLI